MENYNYILENANEIKYNIAQATEKSGRKIDDITIIGVTKTIDVPKIKALLASGIINLGENKVQEFIAKEPELCENNPPPIWHIIGNLQTNKVKYIVGKTSLIHSVDNEKLAEEINKRAMQKNIIQEILVEINIADEDTKIGIPPDELGELIIKLSRFDNVRVSGLMCIAPFVANPEENRAYFRKMYHLFVDNRSKNVHNRMDMKYLSMGMTNDYQIAIEEGSNMVRIGTGFFGPRN